MIIHVQSSCNWQSLQMWMVMLTLCIQSFNCCCICHQEHHRTGQRDTTDDERCNVQSTKLLFNSGNMVHKGTKAPSLENTEFLQWPYEYQTNVADYLRHPRQSCSCENNTTFLNELNKYLGRFKALSNTPVKKNVPVADEQSWNSWSPEDLERSEHK